MILLDTHAWIWWVSEPERLSARAREAIDYTKTLGLCPISCWEVSTKVAKGDLELDRDLGVWIRQALARPRLEVVLLSPAIAVAAGQLGLLGFHGDPADRLIAATAIEHGLSLITKDERLRAFEKVATIW